MILIDVSKNLGGNHHQNPAGRRKEWAVKRLALVICQYDIDCQDLKNGKNYQIVMVMIMVKAMGMVSISSDGNGDRWGFLPI